MAWGVQFLLSISLCNAGGTEKRFARHRSPVLLKKERRKVGQGGEREKVRKERERERRGEKEEGREEKRMFGSPQVCAGLPGAHRCNFPRKKTPGKGPTLLPPDF